MPLSRLILLACIAAVAAWVLPARALAQREPVSVEVQVQNKMYVGDEGPLQVVIHGSRNAEPPDLSFLKDFEAIYRAPQDSSSTMTTIINSRIDTKVNITYTHVYAITPKRAGRLEIPPLTVVVDGRPYTTQPVQIDVAQPSQPADFKLEITSDRATAFVGQPIRVKMVWTLGKDVRGVQFSMPINGCDIEVLPGPETRSVNPNDPNRAVQIRLNGEQTVGAFNQNILTIDRIITPRKAGTLSIGPARADFLTVVGQRPRGPLDSPWDDRSITDRQFSSAPPITIRVEELPTEGRPANFSGLIGRYTIAASADMSSVSLGEPINLTVNVTGPYPLTLVPPLDLARQSNLRQNFRIPRDPILPQVQPTHAAMTAMIRPRSDKATEIGPVWLTYFDPDSRQYMSTQTTPIPLTVRASGSVSLPDDYDDAPAQPRVAPLKRPGGLPDIIRDPLAVGAPMPDLAEQLHSRTTLALIIAPPAACLLAASFIGFTRWRERDPAAARRRAAMSALHRALRRQSASTSPIDQIAHALSNFAADWFDEPRDTLTAVHAAELFQSTGVPSGERLAELLHNCDVTRFGLSRSAAGNSNPADMIPQSLAAARSFAAEFRVKARAA